MLRARTEGAACRHGAWTTWSRAVNIRWKCRKPPAEASFVAAICDFYGASGGGGRLREALVGVSPNVDIDGHKLVWSPPSVVERLEHLLGDVAALGDAAVQPALLVVRLVGLGGVRRAREDARLG